MPGFVTDYYAAQSAGNQVELQKQQIQQNQLALPLMLESQKLQVDKQRYDLENKKAFSDRLSKFYNDSNTDLSKNANNPIQTLQASAQTNAALAKMAAQSGMFDEARKYAEDARKDTEDLLKAVKTTNDDMGRQFTGVQDQASLDAALDYVKNQYPEQYANILSKYPGITKWDAQGQKAVEAFKSSSMGAYKDSQLKQKQAEEAERDQARKDRRTAQIEREADAKERIAIARERINLAKKEYKEKQDKVTDKQTAALGKDIDKVSNDVHNAVDKINNNPYNNKTQRAEAYKNAIGDRHASAIEKIKTLPDFQQRQAKLRQLALPMPDDQSMMVPNAVYKFPDGRIGIYKGGGKADDALEAIKTRE